MPQNNSPLFNPNWAPATTPNANWSDIWNNWAWHSQENNLLSSTGEIQFSEWSQQMLSTMYQNWYNSAPEQMKRAAAAGINPFVASSGIAGSDAGSVAPTPPSTPNSSPLLSSVGSIASAASGSFGQFAQGIATLAKLRHEIRNIDADTENTFESLGFTKLQSKAMSIQLRYLDSKEQIGVWQALATFEKTSQEHQNLVAEHNNILAHFDEILANIDLIKAEQGEVAAREQFELAMKGKVDEEARFIKADNEFYIQHGYRLGTPIYESLRDMINNGQSFDLQSFGDNVSSYEGKITAATEDAKAKASWDYRPSTPAEAAAYAGSHIGSALRNLIFDSNNVNSWPELAQKLKSDAAASREFDEAYNEAKDNLYEEYLAKRRYYRNIKRSGNSQEVSRAENAMITAKNEYDSFTREKFGDEFVKSVISK